MMRLRSRVVTGSSASSSLTIVVCTDRRAARRPASSRGASGIFAPRTPDPALESSRPSPRSLLPSRSRPPNRKKQTRPRTTLKAKEARNSRIGLPGRSLRSTTWLVIVPKMLKGEKPPAVAPLMTMRPMRSGLMPYCRAKPIPIGAMIATAAGTTAHEPGQDPRDDEEHPGDERDSAAHRLDHRMDHPVHGSVVLRQGEEIGDAYEDEEEVGREAG